MCPSRYDDELWELVPEDPGPPAPQLAAFVRSLGRVERALDLGCGDGRLTALIVALGSGCGTGAEPTPLLTR